ncbi:hypothetical protein T4D_13227 [Trichinella pseudospiralis]|uniref:Uncharacterized protein n=1 Tax=Trichinella pseudospiralis TaxID=6337 RepID=A0A0V1C9J5_TRIPS|nr:hypothetical protein T4D_13227 [Trichinella pseudospiralis]
MVSSPNFDVLFSHNFRLNLCLLLPSHFKTLTVPVL